MLNNYVQYNPNKIIFGKNTDEEVGKVIKEYGVKKVLIHYDSGGYYCSNGTQDLTATNIYGKTTTATGRCYFPHYLTTGSNLAYGEVTLYVNGNYFNQKSGEGKVEFYDVPEGSVRACVYSENGDNCFDIE